MSEYIYLIVKCFVVYFIIIFALRIMGKREVGELSVFDIVIYLVMSELLAITISEPKESIFKSLIPIFVLVFLQIMISMIILKSKKIRDVFDGKNVILIEDGYLHQNRMKVNRYNIDDLMSQLRSAGVAAIHEVAFAILENNGQLSVLKKNDCELRYPDPLVSDGMINQEALDHLHKDEKWLRKQIKCQGDMELEDVFLCLYTKNGMYLIQKETNVLQ